MKKISKFFAMALIALSVFCLASCGGNSGGGKTDGDVIEINYWHGNGAALETALEKIKANFEAKYEGKYKVNLVKYGGYDNLRDTLAAAISSGDTPTAAQTYPDHVALYLYGEALQSLDKYINNPEYGMSKEEQAQFIEGFWNEGTIYDAAGTRYALPFNKSTEVMFYNKTIFDKYGWSVPQTWDEVLVICEKYKQTEEYKTASDKNDGVAYVLGYDSRPNLFITLTQQWGAEYTSFNEKGEGQFNAFGAVEKDTKLSQEALGWFAKQNKAKNFATPIDFGAGQDGYCSTAFLNGQCIMTIGSSAGASHNNGENATIDKFVTGVASIPQHDLNNKQVIQQGTNISLFKCDDEDEELGGWLWLKYMVSYESALLWATETDYFAIRKDVMESQEYQDILNGIKRDQNGNEIARLEPTVGAKAKLVGAQQSDAYYTNVAFPGSSKARDKAETIVERILYASPAVSVEVAYKEAYDSILNN